MKKVPGKRVVEITVIQTAEVDGKTLTRKVPKKKEVTLERFEKLKEIYGNQEDLGEGVETETFRDLGDAYGKVREIYGEEELKEAKGVTAKSKKPATPKADTPATGDGQ